MKLTFLGAAGTVTGSKTLLDAAGRRVMVDCGMFQGLKELRRRNWAALPVAPSGIDAVILTHAHIDHSGSLPLLARDGFSGPVLATKASRDLCEILLPDSGFLHERDAEYANKHAFSRHRPALPLYTEQDARNSLGLFKTVDFGTPYAIAPDLTLTFRPAGHILGAAQAWIAAGGLNILFSGDLGRAADPVTYPPQTGGAPDVVVVESTYGDRLHDTADPGERLAEIVNRTVSKGGTVLIPSFAVGRAQLILVHLRRLRREGAIAEVPVFLDSPMAIDASELFVAHAAQHRLSAAEARETCAMARYVRTVDDSKALNANPVPKIIISASGMATGGRVLHHLKNLAPDPRNSIVFAGYQAAGTRGEALINGAERVRIHGRDVAVRATVDNLDMLSAHADRDGLMAWLKGFDAAPRLCLVNHGEGGASEALKERIAKDLGWPAKVAVDGEEIAL